jgi:DNA mismatch endonuclease (patch repair protein)
VIPSPPPSAATATMKANRSRDTGPELRLRRALHARGHRYRVAVALEGLARRVRPDIVFRRARVAVFVDGCFWHGCPAHGRMPRDPTGYWGAKLARNHSRDIATDALLAEAGWTVVRVWEHDPVEGAVAQVERALGQPAVATSGSAANAPSTSGSR